MKILISVMFNENNGSYALQGNNIVHETVNLFQADDGKHYLYVVPKGQIPATNREIDYLLLVRAFSKGTVQVVALAKKLTYRYDEKSNQTEIKYGGESLEDIFYQNTENDNQYLTYEAGELLQPIPTILIQSPAAEKAQAYGDAVKTVTVESRVRNQSMRLFLTDQLDFDEVDTDVLDEQDKATKKKIAYIKKCKAIKKDFETVRSIIEDDTLWQTADYSKVDCSSIQPVSSTFMDLIGKADDEISFSNLFSYFFSEYPDIFLELVKTKGKPQNEGETIDFTKPFHLEREKNRIDIYATDKKWQIIIENKIKSGINGVKITESMPEDGYESQLSKYIRALTHPDSQDAVPVNLDRIICFLFHPDYMKYDFSKYQNGKDYEPVLYSYLLHLFEKHKASIKSCDEVYYQLFLDALRKHTKIRDTDIEERMIARFKTRIKELSSQQAEQ